MERERQDGERSGLHDHRSGLKAALAKTFNDAPCIIRGTKLFIMDEVIKATVLPLLHVALAVQLRHDTVDDGQAAEKRSAAAYLGSLFTDGLGKPVKGLRRTHDNTAILAILCNDFQHFRREVFGLVRAEPILHFVDTRDHALDAVFVIKEQAPVVQLSALTLQGEIGDTLCFGVFLAPRKSLLRHGDGLAVALTAREDNAALMREKLRISGVYIEHELMREQIEKAAQERGLFQSMMLTVLKAITATVQNDTIDKAEKAEHNAEHEKKEERDFCKFPHHLQERFNHCQSLLSGIHG